MKIAYLILAHHAPEQLQRLIRTLPDDSPILIHFDRRAHPSLYGRAVELLGHRATFVKREVCRWGAFGIVQATLNLIDEIVGSGVDYDYASLISGADYPVKSNQEIAGFLQANVGSEFIESFSMLQPNRWSAQGGYYKTPERVLCRHFRFRSRPELVFRLPGRRKMPAGLQPFGGSQWWTLSKRAVNYIADFVDKTPKWKSFAKLCFIPDESFVQTILSNSEFSAKIAGKDYRLVIWDRPEPPFPATLKMSDAEMLLASDCLFARKFDASVDSEILDVLDRRRAAPPAPPRSGRVAK